MDYSQICQGWIYIITNKINGKQYIGKTNNFRRRKWEHISNRRESCPILKRAIKKYGKENFIMEPIVTFTAINKEVLDKVLNELEKFYIKKYDTYNNGYNATLGGDGGFGLVFSEEMRKKWSEVRTGVPLNDEWRKNMALGALSEEEAVPVLQYDLEGTFVKEWECVAFACRALGKRPQDGHCIYSALRETHRRAYGYMWRFKDCDFYPLKITPYINPHFKRICHYSKDDELLGSYNSVVEAMEQTGVPKGTIRSSISNRRHYGKKRRKDYWLLEDDSL